MKYGKPVAALAVVILVAAASSAAASTMLNSRPSYPANCTRVVSCVDNHLNNLDSRLHKQHLQILGLQTQVQSDENQLACFGWAKVAQYPHSSTTANGDTAPGSGGTWLDLMRPDNPANNQAYAFVVNWCQTN